MDKIKLKPCPFCGGEAKLQRCNNSILIGCYNSQCRTNTFAYGENRLQAVKTWNNRVPEKEDKL